nr:DMT family transporter [uncultured Pseudodesulfovibrio sp.]
MIQGLIYALISATAFASLPILVKFGYATGMDGAVMMQYRFSYAAFFLFIFMLIKDRSLFRISLLNLGKCAFLGTVVYWGQTTCFVQALATIPASTTSLILYGYPVVVTLASALLFKTRLNSIIIISLAMVMSGCCLVFFDAFLREVDPVGLAYAFGSMAIFSAYLILTQVLLKDLKPLTATFYAILFAAIAFTISGDVSAWFHLSGTQVLISLALGLFPGILAVALLYQAIEKIGCAYTSIFSSVEPVVTLAAAAAFLGENIVLLQIGGIALILIGIVFPNLRLGQPPKKQPPIKHTSSLN